MQIQGFKFFLKKNLKKFKKLLFDNVHFIIFGVCIYDYHAKGRTDEILSKFQFISFLEIFWILLP
jgi:hypothetical protein